jgi:hypothetical protein
MSEISTIRSLIVNNDNLPQHTSINIHRDVIDIHTHTFLEDEN